MLSIDQELIEAVLALPAERLAAPVFARDDWKGLRAFGKEALALLESSLPEHSDVIRADHDVTSYDGVSILCRWYTPPGHLTTAPGPAIVYLHGGGMITGSVALYDRTVAAYVADSGVPVLSVDYRLAPEHPHPTPVEDCLASLTWLQSNTELYVDPARIAVMGDSGGGGLAAATAVLARDRGVALAKQILIYPMLDDRNTTPDQHLTAYAGWSYDDNYTGWHALLGDTIATADVPATAAPARAKDLTGVADAYVEVGELDIFRDECIEYSRRLSASGVSSELHVHPGCPHGFDRVSSDLGVAKRARSDRLRVIASL
ncbi:MAG: alpha/beta hydrolase [Mycobacteriales bacterium]